MSIQVLTKEMRKARKNHVCSVCSGHINPGEIYEHQALKYDHIYEWKTCKPCLDDNIINVVWNWTEKFVEGITDEDAYEWATEHQTTIPAAKRFLERTNL